MRPFSPEMLPWGGEYIIHISDEVYARFHNVTGSFNVLLARLLGLSYPDSLRYFRDYYNARIEGKEGWYCVMRFDSEKDCQRLCDLLSSRWEQIVRRLEND